MTNTTKGKEILEEIKRVEDSICSYWWPLYEFWENEKEQRESAQTQSAIILDIIETRGRYIAALKRNLELHENLP